jgi:glycosyltransferase involved in cell wall biosynthesis
VGHLIKGLGRGGAESLLPQTIRHRGAGFEYRVAYFLPWKDALAVEVEHAGAQVTCIEARSNSGILRAIPRVVRWIESEQLDLLHCHLPLAGIAGRFAGRWARVPVIYTEHNLQERYHPLTRWANRSTWTLQRAVVAVSSEVGASIAGRMPPGTPVRVVRNGIDLGRWSASEADRLRIRRELGVPEDGLLIGTVAVMRRQKRLDLWLEALRTLVDEGLPVFGVIVGDGPLRKEIESRAAELGLSDCVRFPGLQHEIAPWLAAMDLFLISSEFEGLPLALLEAMATSLPVVATAVGGIPEVIEDGRSGVLVPTLDPRSLAEGVRELLASSARRDEMGREARRRVEAAFSVERMAEELESVYRETLESEATVGARA